MGPLQFKFFFYKMGNFIIKNVTKKKKPKTKLIKYKYKILTKTYQQHKKKIKIFKIHLIIEAKKKTYAIL